MTHVQPEQLQRFLAGEADLMEQDAIAEHLASCETCAALLVQLTAEDEQLTASLRLSEADEAWIAGMDLTRPVMQQIAPWYQRPALFLPALLAFGAAAFMLNLVASLVTQSVQVEPVGLTIDLLRNGIPALWHVNLYLARGGLLATIWPVVLLAGAGYWFRYVRTKKEGSFHA